MSDVTGRCHEYPPAEWAFDGVAEALREANGTAPLRSLQEEATWERLRDDDLLRQAVTNSIETAEDVRDEPIPDLRASQYLEFDRTGDRTSYQESVFERNSRLTALTIAECAEREGRFLDDLIDYVWDVCKDTTWVLPAHLWDEGGLPEVPVGPEKQVTLWRATTGLALAEVDYLLGDDLPRAVRRRIRHEVERRLLEPYEERDEFRWLSRPSNNWSAVCHNGVVQAAMYLLDDPDRIADMVVEERRYWSGTSKDSAPTARRRRASVTGTTASATTYSSPTTSKHGPTASTRCCRRRSSNGSAPFHCVLSSVPGSSCRFPTPTRTVASNRTSPAIWATASTAQPCPRAPARRLIRPRSAISRRRPERCSGRRRVRRTSTPRSNRSRAVTSRTSSGGSPGRR